MVNVNIVKKLLTPNPYSRPQEKIVKVKGIIVHWTASPKGRNQGVWNYFENRKSGKTGYGSAHYIVDLDGTIWNCIPDNELAYHVGSSTYTTDAKKRLGSYPNNCTLGIEFCIIDDRGRMNEATWREGAKLVAYLLKKYNLSTNDIWLHQEVVGWKDCHRYFVENPNEYKRFKNDVANYMQEKTVNNNTNNSLENGAFYTVKSGDTLWGIANQFNMTVDELKKLNMDKNLNVLHIGTVLKIKESNITPYQIQQGDTLWGISRKFDVSIEEIKKLNPNVDSLLQIGNILNIPINNTWTPPKNHEDILPNKVLKMGDTGEDVKKLQNALNKLKFNVGYADGIFGINTKNALIRYQSMYYGLTVDGVFGSATREHMLKQLI